MKIPEELLKALIDGYYLKDFNGWSTDVFDDDPDGFNYEDNKLHLGFGVTIECFVPDDECVVCFLQNGDGCSVNLAIEDCRLSVDDEKIVLSGSDGECRIEILHDRLPHGYIEKHCGRRLKSKKSGRKDIRDMFESEYVGMPEYRKSIGTMTDDMRDVLVRYFGDGEEDAVPLERDVDTKECTIEVVPGHFLRMKKKVWEKNIEERKLKQTTLTAKEENKENKTKEKTSYELSWSSTDGTHKLFMETEYACLSGMELRVGYSNVICYRIGKR